MGVAFIDPFLDSKLRSTGTGRAAKRLKSPGIETVASKKPRKTQASTSSPIRPRLNSDVDLFKNFTTKAHTPAFNPS